MTVTKWMLGGILALGMSVSAHSASISTSANAGDMFFGCVSGNNALNDCANNASVTGAAVDNPDDDFTLTTLGTGVLIELLFTFNPVIALNVDVNGTTATLNAANASQSFIGLTSPIVIDIERDGGGRIEYKITVLPVPAPAAGLLFFVGLAGFAARRRHQTKSA